MRFLIRACLALRAKCRLRLVCLVKRLLCRLVPIVNSETSAGVEQSGWGTRSRSPSWIELEHLYKDWFLNNFQEGLVLPNSCKKSRQSGTFRWFPYIQLIYRFQFYADGCVNFYRIVNQNPGSPCISADDDFEMTREIEAIRWTIVESIVLSELATK